MTNKSIVTAIDIYNATSSQLIAANLRRLLKDYNYKEVAQALGVGTSTILYWINQNPRKLSFDKAFKLCDYLGVDISELWQEVEMLDPDPIPLCRVCGKNPAKAAKGMCWNCYNIERGKER